MSFLMVLSALTALIFAGKKTPESPNLTYASVEDELGEKFDLIGINPNSYSNATIENTAPFDTEKSEVMPGSSLTPKADVFGQISGVTLTVNTFSLTASKSIYFWIYLIDTETFELTFTITDGGEKSCQWFFDSTSVQAAGAGWSLFELKAAEAEVSAENTDRYSVNYKTFAIRYKTELTENVDEYLSKTDEFLSIYHVYTANSYSSNPYSGRVTGLSRAYSAFSSTFISAGKVFKGDEVEFANPYTFFEYLMVGKTEYSALTSYENYIWEITMQEPGGGDRVMDYGDKFSFNTKGWYTLNIKLYEKKKLLNQPVDLNTVLILNQSKSIFCEEITLGSFIVGTTYEMKDNEVLKVGFKFTEGIIISGDIKVEFSNNCAELESQYELDGIYYIEVKGLEKGSVEMEVSATASSVYNKDVKKYSNEITIEVKSSEEPKDWSMTILWITFGCFCAYFGGFLINSLVKARKNDVK
ncbi:MAG: hypothetical protein IJ310_04860 [Clostridia bacterium]|nr:hypothetical protein [Clostridia bacterium]